MTPRENFLRTVRFERPESIPMTFHINAACWHHYDPNALQDLMEAHPFLFPDFQRQERVEPVYELNQLKDKPYTDPWQCVWETTDDGITGSVHQHPLLNWESLAAFPVPDPGASDGTYPVDWSALQSRVEQQKRDGKLVCGGLPHGHTFLRLQDLRGYENVIFDMIDEEPRLNTLIEMLADFNLGVVNRWLELKPDMMSFPEDLGMQVGPMLSPDNFRTYIKPVYERLMAPAREQGCIVHMHSDGDIRTLAADLIDGGVEAINLQDLVNGIDWIADAFAGRTCIDLDIDRQTITPYGTPAQVDALIREEVEKLGTKKGGLIMIYGLYPGVPLENISALMNAMETYAFYYA
ncbi:uroporphyrinogen decarboxylase family protein [Pontiella sulfatireligans]|uniref:Uroporphyrinogen decarboxylase (URO-D) domain-containing protein n=1 Tax=Pontiella sulfatireligans TaxID=2750658 RepID=A0A6C2UF63_9BACT|nr:uroporphyrinogen decarboxylase family protein [Pontiella sulfatireligans]VGO18014.1 hypothetical protein SCARR_00064 [Pontiella sulfatireligans]